MIASPRAKPVIDIVRIADRTRIIEVDEVYLYRRAGDTYTKIPYWKRGEDNSTVAPGDDTNGGSCGGGLHTCVVLAEADYDLPTSTFDNTVRVLDGEGNPTGETIQLDHIFEKNDE
jgi:hypothetical protein